MANTPLPVRDFKRIGILGGMGPEATILLQQRLLAAVKAADDSDHIPLIIDMNPQVPSRIKRLLHNQGDDPAPVLAAMAKRLQAAGAEALAMPCNTAHFYADAITDAVSVPLLNMVELSVNKMAKSAGCGAMIGMLASPAVQNTGVFDKALAAKGLTALWPEDSAKMLRAIQAIKQNGACQQAREALNDASNELLREGAKNQLIACSEFSLIADSSTPEAQTLDTLDILVEAILAFAIGPSYQAEPV